MYDATRRAGPDVVLWRGVSGNDNITVITEDAFKFSISKYEGSRKVMKTVWSGLGYQVLIALLLYFVEKQ